MKDLDFLEEEDVGVQMGPLIDCVFLLLIFFMVVALTKKSYPEMTFTQEQAAVTAEGDAPEVEPLHIQVHHDGRYRISGQDSWLDLPALVQALEGKAAAASGQTIWIEPNEHAVLGMVLPVLDACKGLGLIPFHVRPQMDRSRQPYMRESS